MSASGIDREYTAEEHARYIGSAVLYINDDGTWSVGKVGQKVSDYLAIKVNGVAGLHDDTYEFTALTAEAKDGGGYLVYLQSNADSTVFFEANLDASGNYTGGKTLSAAELYAVEQKYGIDLNDNGGLGDSLVLSAAMPSGSMGVELDGDGDFLLKQGNGSSVSLSYMGSSVTNRLLKDFEFQSVSSMEGGGYDLFLRKSDGTIFECTANPSGIVDPATVKALDSSALATAETRTGIDLNGKGDTALTSGWTASVLKTSAIQKEVDAQIAASGGKIDHAGLVKIVDAAIGSLGSASTIGTGVFGDLQAIASRSKELFTSKDLSGAETGYLTYVFDKMVNGSKANGFYTGGTSTPQSLGILGPGSSPDALQKLENKWLLGKDLPNPATEGDTANPAAAAASGSYKTFDVPLMVGGSAAFDVNQGSAGTCYLLASLANIAQVNPGAFNNTFVSNGAAKDGTQTWGVRFYDTSGNLNWVTANNQLVVKDSADTTAAYAKVKGVDAQGATVSELWAPLLEKAYAQANELDIFARKNSLNAMYAIEGGLAEAVVNVAGGKVTTYADEVIRYNGNDILQTSVVPSGSTALAEYTKALNAGKVVFIVSQANTKDSSGATLFTGGHAYMAYDADSGSSTNTTVKVYNPWGVSKATAETPTPSYLTPFDSDLATLVGTQGIGIWISV